MLRIAGFAAAVLLAACGGPKGSDTEFASSLSGANEIPANPSGGTATATYSVNGSTVSYVINYTGLSGRPTLSHIHVGTDTVNGGVVVPFSNLPDTASGQYSGSFTAATVAAGTAGGVTVNKNDLDSLLRAMKNGQAYTNIHTEARPAGEIRGQILPK
jgi:CHRD domain